MPIFTVDGRINFVRELFNLAKDSPLDPANSAILSDEAINRQIAAVSADEQTKNDNQKRLEAIKKSEANLAKDALIGAINTLYGDQCNILVLNQSDLANTNKQSWQTALDDAFSTTKNKSDDLKQRIVVLPSIIGGANGTKPLIEFDVSKGGDIRINVDHANSASMLQGLKIFKELTKAGGPNAGDNLYVGTKFTDNLRSSDPEERAAAEKELGQLFNLCKEAGIEASQIKSSSWNPLAILKFNSILDKAFGENAEPKAEARKKEQSQPKEKAKAKKAQEVEMHDLNRRPTPTPNP